MTTNSKGQSYKKFTPWKKNLSFSVKSFSLRKKIIIFRCPMMLGGGDETVLGNPWQCVLGFFEVWSFIQSNLIKKYQQHQLMEKSIKNVNVFGENVDYKHFKRPSRLPCWHLFFQCWNGIRKNKINVISTCYTAPQTHTKNKYLRHILRRNTTIDI